MRKLLGTMFVAAWATSAVAVDGFPPSAPAQPPVRWHVSVAPAEAKPGDEVEIVFDAEIAPGWILYSSDFHLEIGPRPAQFTFDSNAGLTLVGDIQPIAAQWKTDKTLGGKYSYFAQHAQFRQKARLVTAPAGASGRITGQTCFEESGLCQLFRETFSTGK